MLNLTALRFAATQPKPRTSPNFSASTPTSNRVQFGSEKCVITEKDDCFLGTGDYNEMIEQYNHSRGIAEDLCVYKCASEKDDPRFSEHEYLMLNEHRGDVVLFEDREYTIDKKHCY